MVGEPLMFYIKCKACVISTINNITVPISEAAHSSSMQPHANRHEITSTAVTFIKYMGIEDAALPTPSSRSGGSFPFFSQGTMCH